MKNKNKLRKAIYISCIALVIIATLLLIIALLSGDFSLKEALSGKLRAELLYILLIVFLALPLLLLLLALAIRVDTKRGQKKPKVINVTGVSLNGGQTTVVGDSIQDAKPTHTSEDTEDEEAENGRGRFCKLCNLDDIRVSLQRTSYDEHNS